MLSYFNMDDDINRLTILEMFEPEQKVVLNRWLCEKEKQKKSQVR